MLPNGVSHSDASANQKWQGRAAPFWGSGKLSDPARQKPLVCPNEISLENPEVSAIDRATLLDVSPAQESESLKPLDLAPGLCEIMPTFVRVLRAFLDGSNSALVTGF